MVLTNEFCQYIIQALRFLQAAPVFTLYKEKELCIRF